jgi:hypothetical protein
VGGHEGCDEKALCAQPLLPRLVSKIAKSHASHSTAQEEGQYTTFIKLAIQFLVTKLSKERSQGNHGKTETPNSQNRDIKCFKC